MWNNFVWWLFGGRKNHVYFDGFTAGWNARVKYERKNRHDGDYGVNPDRKSLDWG